jgi:DNA-binding response OmpR family regulator
VRVLLIEDDRRLTALLTEELKLEGYGVEVAHDGEAGLALAQSGAFAMAVVDWMLPKRDGPSIVRALREAGNDLPILMLSARTQLDDRVGGLDAGADDYLAKPFALRELFARLRAMRRRVREATITDELRCGPIVMDLKAHMARCGEAKVELTSTEWNLLECLMRHPGQALTRQQILNQVWEFDADVQETMVDVYISYVRRKLRAHGHDPVETVRGVGYRCVCD